MSATQTVKKPEDIADDLTVWWIQEWTRMPLDTQAHRELTKVIANAIAAERKTRDDLLAALEAAYAELIGLVGCLHFDLTYPEIIKRYGENPAIAQARAAIDKARTPEAKERHRLAQQARRAREREEKER